MASAFTPTFIDAVVKLTTIDANRRFFFKGLDHPNNALGINPAFFSL